MTVSKANAVTFKWIAGVLVTVLVSAGAGFAASNSQSIAESASEISKNREQVGRLESRTDGLEHAVERFIERQDAWNDRIESKLDAAISRNG